MIRTVGLGLVLSACGGGAATSAVDLAAVDGYDADCAVCGMTVGEQPAPRGQVVYRDGERAHLCSLGDLRALLEAPSPHGATVAVYVEALPAGFDPSQMPTAHLPWVSAESASFVFGAERPMVMGLPVLSFASTADAEPAATALGVTVFDWDAVKRTSFGATPAPR